MIRFLTVSGPILDRFWVPKWSQNRSKIGLKSDHEANAKVLKNTGRGGVFEDAGGRKSIKNRLKKRPYVEMPKQQPKNVRKMVQHGSKVGPSWGHVGFQNRPGRVQGRQKRIPEAIRKEDQKKYRKKFGLGRPPDGKDRGVVVVNETVLGSLGEETKEGGTNLESRHLAPLQQDLKTRSLQASKEIPSHQLKLLLSRRLDLEASLAQ